MNYTSALPQANYAPPSRPWNGLMVVGEAPGTEEIKQNQPFVGRSGQLLDKALSEAGIERAACYVANVFRYQPPSNKVDYFFLSRRAAINANEAIAETYGLMSGKFCRHSYAAEVAALHKTILHQNPRAILALGRTPLWALTGQNGIVSMAGKILPCCFAEHIPVIITYHPSYILRGNWRLMPEWVEHITQVKAQI